MSLPDGTQTKGTVASLRTSGSGDKGSSSAIKGGGSELTMTVTIKDQSAVSGMESGHVGVTVPTGSRTDVLAVPVEALVAVQGGGFALKVVTHSGKQVTLTGVQTGLFADGLVEVSGKGIAAGTKVVTTS